MDDWLKDNLVCPRDHNMFTQLGEDALICPLGHRYPVIEGIPVLLLGDKMPTQKEIFQATLEEIKPHLSKRGQDSLQFDSNVIDPFVQEVIGATCGRMYKPLIKRLSRYPVPKLPLSRAEDMYFLDIGCNWGRWCISAARLGYKTIGIDHNLNAIRAAYRVAGQLDVSALYLVADARYLPFSRNTFDTVFSYSVLQHFSKEDTKTCLAEIYRVLKASGVSMIQMPNRLGIRNLFHQLKRGFKEAADFEVRYWGPAELVRAFSTFIGPTFLLADGFFTLNAQNTDRDMLSLWHNIVLNCSEMLKRASKRMRRLTYYADSLYVESIKQ